MKIGLALGSGGIRGFAHIGAIKVLKRHHIPIQYIAGSSAGAIVGAYLALNGEVLTLAKILGGLKRRDILRLIDLTRSKKSLISGNKIKHFLKELYQDKSFKETQVPLKVVTCDLRSGKPVGLNKGKLANAVLASMSAPGLFPPLKLNGKLLVDGGVIDPTPVDVVRNMGANIVIGIDLTLASKLEIENPSIVVSLMRSFDIIRTQAAKYSIENMTPVRHYRKGSGAASDHENISYGVNKKLILIRPKINGSLNIFKQFAEAEKHIHEGERATEKALANIKNLFILDENKKFRYP